MDNEKTRVKKRLDDVLKKKFGVKWRDLYDQFMPILWEKECSLW